MAVENPYLDICEDNVCDITFFYEGNGPLYGVAQSEHRPRTEFAYDSKEDRFYIPH